MLTLPEKTQHLHTNQSGWKVTTIFGNPARLGGTGQVKWTLTFDRPCNSNTSTPQGNTTFLPTVGEKNILPFNSPVTNS